MFGLIRKKSIKNIIKKEYNKGVFHTEKKYAKIIREMNLEAMRKKEEYKKEINKKNYIIKKQKREYKIYENSKNMVMKAQRIAEFLEKKYLELTHKQIMHLITRMCSKMTNIKREEKIEDRKVYLLKGAKTG